MLDDTVLVVGEVLVDVLSVVEVEEMVEVAVEVEVEV